MKIILNKKVTDLFGKDLFTFNEGKRIDVTYADALYRSLSNARAMTEAESDKLYSLLVKIADIIRSRTELPGEFTDEEYVTLNQLMMRESVLMYQQFKKMVAELNS